MGRGDDRVTSENCLIDWTASLKVFFISTIVLWTNTVREARQGNIEVESRKHFLIVERQFNHSKKTNNFCDIFFFSWNLN